MVKRNKLMRTLKNKYGKPIKKHGKTIKKMNCSPLIDKNTPVKGSCFTANVLELLKKSYNKHNAFNTIHATNPILIWKELKQRLHTCSSEDCWLKEIDDTETRRKLDEYIFAPDRPDEWKKNPHEWLSNFDIQKVLNQYMVKYPNFYAPPPSPIDFDAKPNKLSENCVSNELCRFDLEKHIKNGKTKFGIVFNLSPHTTSGSHWVSVYIDIDHKYIFYMDSAGSEIPKQIKLFVNKIIKQGLEMSTPIELHYYENCPLEHQLKDTECGMFTLYFLITMLTNKADKIKFKNYFEKIKFFKDKRIPDEYVFRFRKIYFNEK